jgi:hypothetical protein
MSIASPLMPAEADIQSKQKDLGPRFRGDER